MTPPRVLVLGDVMHDIIVRPAGPLRHGTDQRATIRVASGGSGANLAAWLARFGGSVRFIGCVGRDDHAAETSHLQRLGIEPRLAAHPDLPTGTLVAIVDQNGERSFLTDRGANDGLDPAWLVDDLLEGIAHVHVSGYAFVGEPTRTAALHLLARARQAGLPVSVDPGSAGFIADLGPARFLQWASAATLCVVNEAEAEALTGRADREEGIAVLGARFEVVLLKCGAAGASALQRGGSRLDQPAPTVSVVDTIGAGDAFLAGFLAARLAGAALDASLARAVQAGTDATAMAGGRPLS